MAQLQKGTVSELWKVSSPMMISFFSMVGMIFVDRLFLSMLSPEALNGAVQSGTLGWAFLLLFMTLGAMSEVFVSQFNGAKDFSRLGEPVWQMLWLTGISCIFFGIVSLVFSQLIYNPLLRPHEFVYFKYLILFGPAFTLQTSLGGFYIGLGRTQIIQWLAILGNTINIVLDPIFIFGIPGYFPALGTKGAAIATGIGTLAQGVVLFALFIRKKNRDNYGTGNWSFNKILFLKSLKVGVPPAIFVSLELFAWSIFYHMMAVISPIHILVASIVQSIMVLFLFFGMGLEKGVTALSGNLIGAKMPHKVSKVLKSALTLNLIFISIASIFLVFKPSLLLDWFFSNSESLTPTLNFANVNLEHIKELAKSGLAMCSFYIFFLTMRWAINGALTAAGDTMFLLLSMAGSIWFFMLLPTYLFVIIPKANIQNAFYVWVFYAFTSCSVSLARFLSGKWKKKELLENLEKNELLEHNRVAQEEADKNFNTPSEFE